MKTCSKCGCENSNELAFCNKCGFALLLATEKAIKNGEDNNAVEIPATQKTNKLTSIPTDILIKELAIGEAGYSDQAVKLMEEELARREKEYNTPNPKKQINIMLGSMIFIVGLLIFLLAILHIPSVFWEYGSPVLHLYVQVGYTFDIDGNLVEKIEEYKGEPTAKELQKKLLQEYPSLFDDIKLYKKYDSSINSNKFAKINTFLANNESIYLDAFELTTTAPTYGIIFGISIMFAGLSFIVFKTYQTRKRAE